MTVPAAAQWGGDRFRRISDVAGRHAISGAMASIPDTRRDTGPVSPRSAGQIGRENTGHRVRTDQVSGAGEAAGVETVARPSCTCHVQKYHTTAKFRFLIMFGC